MENRPDWVVCVARTHADRRHETWCGRPVAGFRFVGLDHAAENGEQQGRLVACPDCVKVATQALSNGHADI